MRVHVIAPSKTISAGIAEAWYRDTWEVVSPDARCVRAPESHDGAGDVVVVVAGLKDLKVLGLQSDDPYLGPVVRVQDAKVILDLFRDGSPMACARLAGLGIPGPLAAMEFKPEFHDGLTREIEILMDELRSVDREPPESDEGALVLTEIQDLHLLYTLKPYPHAYIDDLVEAVRGTTFSLRTQSTMEEWYERYPIPEELRIPRPLSWLERLIQKGESV